MANRFSMILGPRAVAAGHTLTTFETIGSTNAAALESDRDHGAHWFVAARQTAGRGRQGRPWSSPPGNLYASLLLVDPCEPRHAAKLGFVAGIALLQALRSAAPTIPNIRLKWPNDVLLGGAKLAGILLEAQTRAGRCSVAIGMGINLAFHPDDTPYAATSLAAAGQPMSPAAILPLLSDSMVAGLTLFERGSGFDAIRARWLSDAHGVGQPIVARLSNETVTGRFEGLDAEGRLIIDDIGKGGASRLIDAADVYFPGISALGAGSD